MSIDDVSFEDIEKHANKFADSLSKNQRAIHSVLRKYESNEVVCDEILRSIELLKNIRETKRYFVGKVDKISVFLPLNLPLYSFMLFVAVPSYQARKIIVRTPERMNKVFSELYQALSIKDFYGNIDLFVGNRECFVESHCKDSNTIIFTGKYENFLKIKEACSKNTLLIFNGVGHNPLVITETADLDLAVDKTIYVKLFNNGQDCAGPDMILVHSKVIEAFIKKLVYKLQSIRVENNYNNDETRVGPLFEPSSLVKFGEVIYKIIKSNGKIIYGGEVDYKDNIIYPCVSLSTIRQYNNYDEIYSPLFILGEYERDDELGIYFTDFESKYAQKQMYVSVFGYSEYLLKNLPASIILKSCPSMILREVLKNTAGMESQQERCHTRI